MTPEIRQQVLDKQRETHAQKLAFEKQLHRKRKAWMADLAEAAAAKERANAAKEVRIQEAKAVRLAKRARQAEARQRQLAVLGAREQAIRVRSHSLCLPHMLAPASAPALLPYSILLQGAAPVEP